LIDAVFHIILGLQEWAYSTPPDPHGENPIRHIVTPPNSIGFNSKGSEDMATDITKNRWF